MDSASVTHAPLIARRYGIHAYDLGDGVVIILASFIDDSEALRKRRGMVKVPTRGLPHAYLTMRTTSGVHSLLCRVSKDKVARNVPARPLRIRETSPKGGFQVRSRYPLKVIPDPVEQMHQN